MGWMRPPQLHEGEKLCDTSADGNVMQCLTPVLYKLGDYHTPVYDVVKRSFSLCSLYHFKLGQEVGAILSLGLLCLPSKKVKVCPLCLTLEGSAHIWFLAEGVNIVRRCFCGHVAA